MKKFRVSLKSLEATIDYVHKNNPYNLARCEIYKSIMDSIMFYYDNPKMSWTGTMGYVVKFDELDDIVLCDLYVLPTYDTLGSLDLVGTRENTTVEFRV